MDYRDDQLGIQANTGGAILVEGTWYCPALPGPLITATTDLRGHAITRELYDQQITARGLLPAQTQRRPRRRRLPAAVLPRPRQPPRADLPAPQASLSPRDGRPKVLQPPQEPPRLCRQTAITIAPDIGARYRQDLPYGSPAWHARYATLRNTIEGLNGYAKDPAHQALAQPARRRVRGIAAQLPLHRAAADRRQHPQDPRLAGPHRQRQGPHHPPGTATPRQPARLPPRRLTARSTHRHHRPAPPSRAAATPQARQNARNQAAGRPVTQPARQPEPMSDPARILRNRSPKQFCRYDTGSSVGNPW